MMPFRNIRDDPPKFSWGFSRPTWFYGRVPQLEGWLTPFQMHDHKLFKQWSSFNLRHLSLGKHQCSRIRILGFSQISKKHDYLHFLEMTFQKNVKSQKVSSFLNVYRNFGLKIPGCYGYLWAFITHSSQLHSFLCPNFWARCLMLVTVTYRYRLPVNE